MIAFIVRRTLNIGPLSTMTSTNLISRLIRVLAQSTSLRPLLWRVGRSAYAAARGDFANDPRTNGEYWLLAEVLRGASSGAVLFDVGANMGDWTVEAQRLCAEKNIQCNLHAFEPAAATRAMLSSRVSAFAEVHACALSDRPGETAFYSTSVGAGSNSLYLMQGAEKEVVRLATLDQMIADAVDGGVLFVKVDTEGFDLSVLRGAEESLKGGLIEVVQFEYNWRWLQNHASLLDVFAFIEALPYRLGKLAGERIEFYDVWHFELDRFIEANFVLVRRGSSFEAFGTGMEFNDFNTAAPSK